MELERRIASEGFEVREGQGKRPRLVGYAAVFNSRSAPISTPIGEFVEYVRPGAFSAALASDRDVVALWEHTQALILGRRSAGTLVLAEDDRGLKVEILPPDTTAARDVIENIRAGNLNTMSFAFTTQEHRFDHTRTPKVRELLAVDLHDVSVVASPAYPKTDVAVRSFVDSVAAWDDPARKLADARRRVRLAELQATLSP